MAWGLHPALGVAATALAQLCGWHLRAKCRCHQRHWAAIPLSSTRSSTILWRNARQALCPMIVFRHPALEETSQVCSSFLEGSLPFVPAFRSHPSVSSGDDRRSSGFKSAEHRRRRLALEAGFPEIIGTSSPKVASRRKSGSARFLGESRMDAFASV
jgi:hypothetical protein